jgi:hypothetical protein
MPVAVSFDMSSKVILDIIKFQALASTSPPLVGFFLLNAVQRLILTSRYPTVRQARQRGGILVEPEQKRQVAGLM